MLKVVMKEQQILRHFSIITGIFLMLLSQVNCNISDSNISLYFFESNQKLEPDIKMFINTEPDLVLGKDDIRNVRLTQNSEDHFTIEVTLSENIGDEINEITSSNIGKRAVFISGTQILFAPLILESTKEDRIVVEMSPIKREEAKNIAGQFMRSFEFVDNRILDKELDFEVKKLHELCTREGYDKAAEKFEKFLKENNQQPNTRITLYNEIAVCYRLKGDRYSVAEAYKKLINERVSIDLDNYMAISQAYFYLSQFEKRRGNIERARSYFDEGVGVLEYIIKNYPTTQSAEWANLTICTYELLRGNIKEAQKRGIIAKRGNLGAQGYLLLGLTYEYDNKLKEARREYESLIKEFPNTLESQQARELITNLDNGKSNLKGLLDALEQP